LAKFDNLNAVSSDLGSQLGGFNVPAYLRGEALRVSTYRNFTLHRFLGAYVGGEPKGGTPNFQRVKNVVNEYRIPFQLALPGFFSGVARGGAAHKAAYVPAITDDHGGAGRVLVAEYIGRANMGTDEKSLLIGEGTAVEMATFWRNLVIDDWHNTLGTALWTAAAPTDSVLGGIPYAIDDGNTYDVYCGVKRSDAANADMRGYVDSTAEPLSPRHFFTADATIATRSFKDAGDARVDTIVAGTALYVRAQEIALSYSQAQMNEKGQFGFTSVKFAGYEIGLDQRAPDGHIYFMDSRSHYMLVDKNDGPLALLDWGIDQTTVASYMAMWQSKIQHVCIAPWCNYKMTGKS